MESEQFSLSLPPSPGHHRANSPVQFSCGCLAPSLEARDAVSFGLFSDAVNAVVDKFRAAKMQSAVFKQFMPRRAHEPASASSSRELPAPSKEPVGRVSEPMHPPPYTVWGARGRSASRQRPRKRVDLKRPNEPPTTAYLSISEMLSSANCGCWR